MALIGLHHTFAAGDFDDTALQMIMAGFKYCTSFANTDFASSINQSPDHQYWGASGAVFGSDADDAAFFGAYYSTGSLAILALRGFDLAPYEGSFPGFDVENYPNPRSYYSFGTYPDAGEILFRMVLDTVEGTFVLWARDVTNDQFLFCISGLRSRRYPVDGTTDNICRFGLFVQTDDNNRRSFLLPRYGFAGEGLEHYDQGKLDICSPLGNGPVRGAALTGLGKVVAPMYPQAGYMSQYNMTAAAALMGEFTSAMSASDAYAHEEQVVPGWLAFGNDTYGMVAYRSPAIADFLDIADVALQ